MLDDMNVRRFTPDTQRDYIRAVKKLAAFLGRSPDTATAEDLRAFRSTGRRRRGTWCLSASRASCRACSRRRSSLFLPSCSTPFDCLIILGPDENEVAARQPPA
jgi:integrase-like protein